MLPRAVYSAADFYQCPIYHGGVYRVVLFVEVM